MKKNLAIILLIFAGALPLRAQLADIIDLPEAPNQVADEDILKTWAWLLAENYNLYGYEFNDAEMQYIFDGMLANVRGEAPALAPEENSERILKYFTEREERIFAEQLARNQKEEEAFFDALFGTPGVQMLGSGLYYQIIKPGNDVRPDEDDDVIVRYEGRFLDNTVFDAATGERPAAFNLKNVIPAWTQGLRLIGEGGSIKLFVPAKLAYGDEPRQGIPPGSTLVFEINLLKVGLPEEASAGAAAPPEEEPSVDSAETE